MKSQQKKKEKKNLQETHFIGKSGSIALLAMEKLHQHLIHGQN